MPARFRRQKQDMRSSHTRLHLTFSLALAALFVTACEQGASPNSTVNTNTNVANTNVNMNTSTPIGNTEMGNINSSNTTGNMPSTSGGTSTINTREPERYRATIVFTAQAGGSGNARAIPPLSAEVARDGTNRRIAFQIPGTGEQFVFLDRADKRYIVMPNRKQYGELTSASIGFDLQRTLTPGQIVTRLQQTPGVERVGEEQRDGRTVTKYRYAGRAQTGTAAGQAQSESFIFIDNNTGLPLYAELYAQTQGSVQGMNQAKGIVEMRNISTDVESSAFELPQGFQELTPDQMRQQVQGLMQLVQLFVGMMSNQMNNQMTTPAATPPTR